MRKNNNVFVVFATIGALLNIVASFALAYFASGGKLMGIERSFDLGVWNVIVTVMAVIGAMFGIIGVIIIPRAIRTAGLFMLVSSIEYIIVSVVVAQTDLVPYLLIGGIGALIILVCSFIALMTPDESEKNVSIDIYD